MRLFAVPLLLACGMDAHTLHRSMAQIEWISAKRSLEVMLLLHGEDIERLVKSRLGAGATLDRPKQVEPFLFRYLGEHFELRDGAGKAVPFEWVGMEVHTHFVTVYLEARADTLTGWTLRNRILFGELPDQSNAVLVKRDGKAAREITFDQSAPPKWVPVLP